MVHFIPYRESIIAYRIYGDGSIPIFCFHGFSLSSIAYEELGKYCPMDKKMFALDFPFHGETDWAEKDLFVENLMEICQLIVQKEMSIVLEKFELIGHSMGGRICQYIYQSYSERINKMILLAPDGLVPSFWRMLLFRTSIGPFIFRKLNQSTRFIMRLSKACLRLHIINKSLFNLISSAYEDPEKAYLVYQRLMVTKDFYPDRKTVAAAIRQYQTPIILFFGKYDKIVPEKWGNYFKQKKLPNFKIEVLLSGHLILANKECCKLIAAVL